MEEENKKNSAKEILEESIDSIKNSNKKLSREDPGDIQENKKNGGSEAQGDANPSTDKESETSKEKTFGNKKKSKLRKAEKFDDEDFEDDDDEDDDLDDEEDLGDEDDDLDDDDDLDEDEDDDEDCDKDAGGDGGNDAKEKSIVKPGDSRSQKKTVRCCCLAGGVFIVIFLILPLIVGLVAEYLMPVSMDTEPINPSIVQPENPQENNASNNSVELEKKFNTDDLNVNNDKIGQSNNIIEATDQSSKTVFKEENVIETGGAHADSSDADGIGALFVCIIIYLIVCTIMVCNKKAVVFVGWGDYVISLICSIFILVAIGVPLVAIFCPSEKIEIDISFLALEFFGLVLLLLQYIRLCKFNTKMGALLLLPYKSISSILFLFCAFTCLGEIFRGQRDDETDSSYTASKIVGFGFGYLLYKFSKRLIRDPEDF